MNSQKSKFHYLFVKDLRRQIEQSNLQIQSQIHQIKQKHINIKHDELIERIIRHIRSSEQGKNMMNKLKQEITQKANQLYDYESRKQTFMIDCIRQATSYPIIDQTQQLNFGLIYKKLISKQLRRLVWTKILVKQQNKQQFFTYDREICPYNVQMELGTFCQKIGQKDKIILKENQRDLAVRILQYKVKKDKQLPRNNQYYLVCLIVQLYSFQSIKQCLDIGAIYIGLLNLTLVYYEPNLSKRIENILLALQLIDPQSHKIVMSKYISVEKNNQSFEELNSVFELFRLTLGACFLSFQCSQFLIDQILIKKRSAFDIYVFFAMTLMILSDQFDKAQTITELLSKGKEVIQIQDIVDCFNVCYEKIPRLYNVPTSNQGKNQLLQKIIQLDEGAKPNINSLKNIISVDIKGKNSSNSKFLFQNTQILRLGKKQL